MFFVKFRKTQLAPKLVKAMSSYTDIRKLILFKSVQTKIRSSKRTDTLEVYWFK